MYSITSTLQGVYPGTDSFEKLSGLGKHAETHHESTPMSSTTVRPWANGPSPAQDTGSPRARPNLPCLKVTPNPEPLTLPRTPNP